MIRIQGLHKYFNRGKQNEIHVINNVSLDLPEKGMVAIFGKSGCGKTTLLNVIGGLDRFAEGTLTIEGKSILADTDVIRNQYIGYIFQNYNLHKSESCFDNVADALRLCGMTDEEQIRARVTAALTNVGMEKYARRTPDTLSGGQQQRIAIARAIVKNPRIILADEPTGNLDEANTVMIMDLLKAIAEDHLVLLVTHEENLVDFYCDRVIELQDGKVIDMRENASAGGFSARDKNDIFLGELERREITGEGASIEYYGDLPTAPIRLRIVNSGGKIYVQLGTENARILDETSEIKLREGVYKEKGSKNAVSEGIDMSALPPVVGTRFGRLFSLKSSIKSGYIANFKGKKKRKGALRRVLCLFSAVTVLLSAVFGTSFGDLAKAKSAYNHNVFYVEASSTEASARLNAAVSDSGSGVDFVRLAPYLPDGDSMLYFRTGTFETFSSTYSYTNSFGTNAVLLDTSLTKDMKLLAGKKDGLSDREILISSKMADDLLEKSTLGYITEYRDLIGLISDGLSFNGTHPYIAGVVSCDEPAVYLTERAMAKYVHEQTANLSASELASSYGIEVSEGEAILAIRVLNEKDSYPKAGDTVKIQGRDIKIKAVRISYSGYEELLSANDIEMMDESAFYKEIVKTENPGIDENSIDFEEAMISAENAHRYDYLDYYYSHFEKYLENLYFFHPDNSLELWLYMEKGIELAKYTYFARDYYKAVCYKNQFGHYPTVDELDEKYNDFPDAYEELNTYRTLYSAEYYGIAMDSVLVFGAAVYLVHDSDYIAFSKQVGETHPSAKQGQYYDYSKETVVTDEAEQDAKEATFYTVIHSSDPEKTATWLEAEILPLIDAEDLVTPDTVFARVIQETSQSILSGLLTLVLFLALMSVCMYFIMRSSLLGRIKEVGIYRAIGVSKKNLLFKFFIEAIVLTVLTVFVGYLATSGFLIACFSMSSLMSEIFYYPFWLAGVVLLILSAISLFFGTLPVLSLMRKTPSEILAKYDI